MEITCVPARILGLDACSACVAAKMVHLPHKEGRGRATEYLERVHVEIAGPMHVLSARGRLYLYVAVTANRVRVAHAVLLLKAWLLVKNRARTGRPQDVGRACEPHGLVQKNRGTRGCFVVVDQLRHTLTGMI